MPHVCMPFVLCYVRRRGDVDVAERRPFGLESIGGDGFSEMAPVDQHEQTWMDSNTGLFVYQLIPSFVFV